MWMAKTPQTDPLAEPGAELGQVALAGPPVGVALAGERRNVTVCLPGGYHWTPQPGQAVLVVKSGPEGSPCLVGRPGGRRDGPRRGVALRGPRGGGPADEGRETLPPGAGGGGRHPHGERAGGGPMIALLRNGDYCPDGMGGFRQAWGGEEVLERVLFQLTARRGSFPLLPQVGSRLYLLGREKPAARGPWGRGMPPRPWRRSPTSR